ncbi:MAG: contractile injection system tape measure protein, partial [Bacteroidota bacterium]
DPEVLEVIVDVIRYYLTHGSLSHKASQNFTRKRLEELMIIFMKEQPKVYIRVFRALIQDRKVRMRIANMGEEFAIRNVRVMNLMVADQMEPYVRAILKLIQSGGSPISEAQFLEHAIEYASKWSRPVFQPMDYVKELFAHMRRGLGKSLAETVRWMQRRNEENNVPIKVALKEMLEIMDVQAKRREAAEEAGEIIHEPEEIPEDVAIYVENAGVMLVWPFLGKVFSRAGLLVNDEWKDEAAQEYAVHLIQYIANKEEGAPEEALFLNKIVVGLPTTFPLERTVVLEEEHKNLAESMLKAVCFQWSVMKNSDPDTLRKTWFLREGVITRGEESWTIRVEKKAFDMLLKKLPWSLSMVHLGWLEETIEVEWG